MLKQIQLQNSRSKLRFHKGSKLEARGRIKWWSIAGYAQCSCAELYIKSGSGSSESDRTNVTRIKIEWWSIAGSNR